MSALLETVKNSLLELVGGAIEFVPALVTALIIICLIPYTIKPIRRFTRVVVERFTDNFSLQLLAVQAATVGIWAGGVLLVCILLFPDLGLGDIIALLGLSSVAVGFAFQDIFKNFLAGILLLLNQPFQVGDQIIVNDYEGTVDDINIRATKIRTYNNENIVIPNSLVFTNPIEVLTEDSKRRTDLVIGLDYNTPLPQAREVLHRATATVAAVLDEPAIEVDITEFGDSSINFIVRYWTQPTQLVIRRTRTQVIMALKAACDQADYNIPYPIRTVYHFDQQKFEDATAVAGNNGSAAQTSEVN